MESQTGGKGFGSPAWSRGGRLSAYLGPYSVIVERGRWSVIRVTRPLEAGEDLTGMVLMRGGGSSIKTSLQAAGRWQDVFLEGDYAGWREILRRSFIYLNSLANPNYSAWTAWYSGVRTAFGVHSSSVVCLLRRLLRITTPLHCTRYYPRSILDSSSISH